MKRVLFYLAISLVISACGSSSPAPEDHYYRLPALNADTGQAPLSDNVIFVEQLIAEGIYHERSIIYSDDADAIELNTYHYHHWMDNPSRLIRDHLIDYLRSAQLAKQVVSVPEIPATLSIFGRIRQFERRVTNSGVVIQVKLLFRVNNASSDTPLLLKDYSRSEKLHDDSISASVTVFANLLGDIYRELVEDIRNIGT